MTDISTKYMGLKLRSPLIVASSGISDTLGNIHHFEKNDVGAVVLKSLFEEEILAEKHAKLKKMGSSGFIYPENLDFYDYLDDKTYESTEKYLQYIRELKQKTEIPIIASINCFTADQWTFFPKEIELAGADALELNVFLLPSDLTQSKEDIEKMYFDVINAVTKEIKIPVALKLSYYFTDLAAMLKRLSETRIKGMVMFNRFYHPDIDIHSLDISTASVLSHPEDYANTLRWIAIMSDHLDCDIAASTGVHNSETMIKMLLAGASAVQAASVFYHKGVDYSKTMIEGLKTWMQKMEYKSIKDFKGKMSQQETGSPEVFQRVQFMKYFRALK